MKQWSTSSLLGCLLTVLLAVIPSGASFAESLSPVSGRILSEKHILPADVLSRAKLVQAELALIQLELGKPELAANRSIEVSDIVPRAVFFAAQSLFRKTSRLAFEQVRIRVDEPPPQDTSTIRPFHVWMMLEGSRQSILKVKKSLGITEVNVEQVSPLATSPGDVYTEVSLASRRINQLLERQFSPSNVFQQVSLGIHTAAQLIETFPGRIYIPKKPEYERRKKPSEVYNRLVRCFSKIETIAALSNMKVVKLDLDQSESHEISPSDVYDLASLVLSELSYFHVANKRSQQVAATYYPGKKIPSDVYQRVGVLERQLVYIEKMVRKNPRWLDS